VKMEARIGGLGDAGMRGLRSFLRSRMLLRVAVWRKLNWCE
jgi:hypothetical protein